MKRRSGFAVMGQLIGLVRPLSGYMALAVTMGLAGHLCAAFLTVFGVYALCTVVGLSAPLGMTGLFIAMAVMAVMRAALRYGEQACNHFIAFKLLALLRDKVFRALRALAPAKLEVRDRGDLISVITSDIELLEVFYAHTISPVLIAVLFSGVLTLFIGQYHPLLGLLALGAYLCIGLVMPVLISRASGAHGLRFRTRSGELSSFVLDSLRGLSETLQYAQGGRRRQELDARTRALVEEEARLKWTAGWGMSLTSALILLFDLAMLLAAAALYRSGQVGLDGVLVPTVALMSSFGPTVALANLGGTLQNTFAAGNRVLDILQETPLVRDVTGQAPTEFTGADAQIEEACRKASVHEFILSLPQGYDTPVGELGDTLSGGERQRLGLARAFLHDAPFLLLDEPTSNLDSLNEAVILQSLRREREGRTVVLVSHRQSTMRVADRVVTVDAGRCS